MIQLTAFAAGDKSFDDNLLVGADRLEIFHAQVRRDGVFGMKPARLAHDFVQQHSDDSAVKKSRAALVFIAKLKTPDDALARVVLLEGQLHAARVCAAAAEASVSRFGVESHRAVAQASACVLRISQGLTAHRPARPAGGLKSVLLKPLRTGPSLARDQSWSDQRHAGHFRAAGSALSLAHFEAQHIGQRGDPSGDFALIEPGKTEPQRVGHWVLQVKIASRREHNTPFPRMNQEFVGVEPRRKFDPYAHPAFWARPLRAVGHLPAERLLKSGKAGAVLLPSTLQMAAQESPAHILRQNGLGKLTRVQISGLLNQAQTVNDVGGGDNPADAQPRKRNFRKAVDLHHQIRTVELLEGGNALATGTQTGVNVVFDDRNLESGCEFKQATAFGNRKRRPSRIVEIWSKHDHFHAVLH